MLDRKEIVRILNEAQKADPDYIVFGAEKHKYKLNPLIEAAEVRAIEEKYGFTLPEDYFKFITEIGDGGAGPDYGLYSFADFEECNYPTNIAKRFCPHNASAEEAKEINLRYEVYEQNKDKVFTHDDEWPYENGFLLLGTRGCQYDFIMPVNGKHRGKVFDTDNETCFYLVAKNFNEFYTNWLGDIASQKLLKKAQDLEARINALKKGTKKVKIKEVKKETKKKKKH